MQPRRDIRIDDLAADGLDGESSLVNRENTGSDHEDAHHEAQQNIQNPVMHHRTPRARAGSSTGATCTSGIRAGATVIVSLGIVIDCGPGVINFSNGRYIMLLPFLTSTRTLREFLNTLPMVSRYMRSRVTAGERSYCSNTWSKRDVSPCAIASTCS